jgi:hypothetical protein
LPRKALDIMGTHVAQRFDHAGLAMHAHFGDQRDEGREMAAESDSAADHCVSVFGVRARRRSFLPAALLNPDKDQGSH